MAGKTVSAAQGSKPNEITLTTDDALKAGTEYTAEVLNAKDFAGNIIATSPSSVKFTVTNDSKAPQVTSVKAIEDDTIEVTFDKSIANLSGNVSLLDGNGVTVAAAPTVSQVDTEGKVFYVTIPASAYTNSDTPIINVFLKDTIKDTAGNALSSVTKQVSVTKDTVAPKVQSVTMIKNTTYTTGAFVVTFDEAVKGTGSAVSTSDFKLIDQNGLDLTAGSGYYTLGTAIVNPKNDKQLIVPVATTTIPTTSKTATVMINKDVFTDDSNGANGNAAKTVTNVSLTPAVSDTEKPVVGTPSVSGSVITYTVTDDSAVDTATLLNLDNYRLDGKSLPDGSYVTLTGAAGSYTVKVNLGSGTITKSQNYAFSISGIKDTTGNTASTVAVNDIALTDNVAPTFQGVAFNTDGTATLTFSEAVTSTGTPFTIKANGNVTLTEGTDYTVAPITSGADAGKLLVTFIAAPTGTAFTSLSDINSVQVTLNAAGVVDGDSNAAVLNVTKSATK